jgi:single-strand DNA-binding protein
MTGFNRVVLVGNLTRDPELRFTPNGIPVCEFGLAVNRVRSKDDAPDYFQVVAWRELGEIVANYKKKGDGVLVEGRLRYDAWEAEDGSKRSKVTVVAEQVQFLSSPNGKRGGSSGSGATRAGNGSGGSGRRGGSETAEEEWDDIPFAHLQRKSPVF